MADILNTTQTYVASDVVTHTNLNQIIDGASFVVGDGGATDNDSLEVDSTTGSLQIKDDGVTTAKLLDSTDKTDGVTFPKIQHISTDKVLGRQTANDGDVEEVNVVIGGSGADGILFDNDDMLDNDDTAGGSATRGATQQSIKTYVDNQITDRGITQTSGSAPYFGCRAFASYSGSAQTLRHGSNISSVTRTGLGVYKFTFVEPMPDASYAIVTGGSFEGVHTLSYTSALQIIAKNSTDFTLQVQGGGPSGGNRDVSTVDVAVYR